MLKVTHIEHSGFCLETPEKILIFDWYTGDLPDFSREKPVYVFVSHSHSDHYGRCIWKLGERCSKVSYILDSGIPVLRRKEDILFTVPENHYEVDDLQADTFESNDEGTAFLVNADGYRIYHAGDLNLWLWDDNTRQEEEYMRRVYASQMQRLRECLKGKKPDAAMVPLDPRLGKTGAEGLACFMEEVGAEYVFPMHYSGQKAKALAYMEDERLKKYKKQIHFEDVFVLS